MKNDKTFFPFKYKVIIYTLILSFIVVSIFGIIQFFYTRNILNEQNINTQQILEQKTIESIKFAEGSYSILESSFEENMKSITTKIIEEYEKTKDIKKINLNKYTEDLTGYDIYFINNNNIIEYTTDKDDFGLNFNKFPNFIKILDNIRYNKNFVSDRLNLTIVKNEVKKFSYQPTKDGKYIVEIGVNLNKYLYILKDFNFDKVSKNIIHSNSIITDVSLYDGTGKAYYNNENGNNKVIRKDHLIYLKQSIDRMKKINIINTINRKKYFYRYIPYVMENAIGTNKVSVIEIIYNDNDLKDKLKKNLLIFISVFTFSLVAAILIGLFISGIIYKPVTLLIDAMKKINLGDFDHQPEINTNDEFELLAKNFNTMISSLMKLIKELLEKNEEIEKQKQEIKELYIQTNIMNEELKYYLNETKKNYLDTVRAIANSIEAMDKYTGGHCERVTQFSIAIAKKMELQHKELLDIEFASLLHDVGKIGVPINVINKGVNLTDHEFDLIKKHPQIGYDILKHIAFLKDCSLAILQHHERVDGKGYPNNLKDGEISILAKIIAVADSYDAMTSNRPYKNQILTMEDAIDQLNKSKGIQFDEKVVDNFVEILRNNYSLFDFSISDQELENRNKISDSVSISIINNIDINNNMTALECGGGNGLLSLRLNKLLKNIKVIDSSKKMIDYIENKKEQNNIKNTETILFDFKELDVLNQKFDLVLSSMTLHFIKDVNKIISDFYKILNDNGKIAIADLIKEDGDFYESNALVQANGFEVNELKNLLLQNGFKNIKNQIVHSIKKTKNNKEKNFDVFLIIGEK